MAISKGKISTTNQPAPSGGGGAKGPPQFIKYRLSEEELAQAREACNSAAEIGEIISQLIGERYKFSASFDKYGGGIQAFITPSEADNPNWGFTLTARAPDLDFAVGVLAWKHYTLFEQFWPKNEDAQKGGSWG